LATWIGRDIIGCTIVQQIGSGPRGEVFRAISSDGERTIAVKVFDEERQGAEQPAVNLRRNLRMLRQIRDPHLVRILWDGRLDGWLVSAMEMADDGNLQQFFDPGSRRKSSGRVDPLFIRDMADLALGILHGLEALHRNRIVHGALVPQNVLMFNGNRIALSDGGLGMPFPGQSLPLTRAAFLAPELSTGSPRPDSRSDYYSLGAILYWLLSGRLPGVDTRGKLLRQDEAGIVPLEVINPDLPEHVTKLVHCLLRPNMKDRLPGASLVRSGLRWALGSSAETRPTPRRSGSAEPRFIGRAGEADNLLEAAEAAADGQLRLAMIQAREGMGKTGLLQQIIPRLPLGMQVCWPAGLTPERSIYGGIGPVVREIVRPLLTGPAAEQLKPFIRQELSDIQPLVRLAQMGELGDRLQAEHQGAMALAALAVLLVRQQPTLLVFDGLDRTDAASLRVILLMMKFLFARARKRIPCLIAVTSDLPEPESRAAHIAKLAADAGHRALLIELSPMTIEETALLVSDMLGGSDVPDSTAQLICEVSQGSPAAARELVRLLVEEGILQPGVTDPPSQAANSFAARVAEIASGLRGSGGAAAVAAAAVAALPAASRELLDIAAVVGERFERDVITAASGTDPKECQLALSAPLNRRLIEREQGVGGEFAFVHPVVRLVILNAMPEARRRDIHRRLFGILSQRASTPELTARLTAHAFGAKLLSEAIQLGTGRAKHLIQNAAHHEALRLLHDVLAAAGQREREGQPVAPEQIQRAMAYKGRCELRAHDIDAAERTYQSLLHSTEAHYNPEMAGAALWGLGFVAQGHGRTTEAEELYRKAMKLAMANQLEHLRIECLTSLGVLCLRLARLDEARRCFELVGQLVEMSPDRAKFFSNMQNIASVEVMDGNLRRALELYHMVEDGLRREGQTLRLAGLYSNLALVSLRLNRLATARHALENGLALAKQYMKIDAEAGLRSVSANVYVKFGDLDRAAREMHRAIAACRQLNDPASLANMIFGLGRIQKMRGDRGAARSSFRRAKALFEKLEFKNGQILSEFALAEAEAPLDAQQALARINAAFESGLTTTMEDLDIQYHFAKGHILRSAGHFPESWDQYRKGFRLENQLNLPHQTDRLMEAMEVAREAEEEEGAAKVEEILRGMAEDAADALDGDDLDTFRRTQLGRWLRTSDAQR